MPASPEAKAARARDLRLQRTYGITQAQYDELLAYQNGRCAICDRKTTYRLHVDHDHKTGLVRGLLCWTCNHRLLPSCGDDWTRALMASTYLQYPPAVETFGRIIAPPKPKRKRRRKTTTTTPPRRKPVGR